jgi:plastocyanin
VYRNIKKEIIMKIFIVIIVVAVLAVGGYLIYRNSYNKSTSSSSSSTSVSTNSVNINNFAFDPSNITVTAGSKITFTNKDSVTHTVTADNGKFNQQVNAGATTTITISDPGTYGFHCSIHSSMKGTIIVQ